MTGAVLDSGLRAGIHVDHMNGKHFDLFDRRVEAAIGRLLRRGRVWCAFFGTPCTRWSRARATGTAESRGSQDGLACAWVTVRLFRICHSHGISVCLENPRSSALFDWPPIAAELRRAKCSLIPLDLCRGGAPT